MLPQQSWDPAACAWDTAGLRQGRHCSDRSRPCCSCKAASHGQLHPPTMLPHPASLRCTFAAQEGHTAVVEMLVWGPGPLSILQPRIWHWPTAPLAAARVLLEASAHVFLATASLHMALASCC
jgi:hypothetical protein